MRPQTVRLKRSASTLRLQPALAKVAVVFTGAIFVAGERRPNAVGQFVGRGRGSAIPIEQRPAEEITHGFGLRTAPEGVDVYDPAFDVTRAELITAIICQRGVIRPVTPSVIAQLING